MLERTCLLALPDGLELVNVTIGIAEGGVVSTRPMAILSTPDDWVSSILRAKRGWEIRSPAQILRGLGSTAVLPKTGTTTFLDIGANLGFYSLLFAARGDNVVAIEPMATNRAAFAATLCHNPDIAHRVMLVPSAVGSTTEAANSSCVVRAHARKNLGNGLLECGTRSHYSCTSAEPPAAEMLKREGLPKPLSLSSWKRRLRPITRSIHTPDTNHYLPRTTYYSVLTTHYLLLPYG